MKSAKETTSSTPSVEASVRKSAPLQERPANQSARRAASANPDSFALMVTVSPSPSVTSAATTTSSSPNVETAVRNRVRSPGKSVTRNVTLVVSANQDTPASMESAG